MRARRASGPGLAIRIPGEVTKQSADILRKADAICFDEIRADYYPFSHDFSGKCATRIINQVRGVNRVVYDVTSKPPGTIEWE